MRSAAIRLSEVREQINQGALDAMPKERLEALRKESIGLETEYRAEILHEEPADRVELRSLYDGIELRGYMDAAINGGVIEGRALELNQHLGLPASHGATFLPYAALLAPGDRLEVRADAITNPPSGAGGRDQDVILARVFASSASGFLGVEMKSVAYTEPNYVVFSTGVSPENKADEAVKDAEVATLTPFTLEPLRLTARYSWNYTDNARIMGLEEALRQDLSAALSEQMDKATLTGDGTAPNVQGFLAALTDPTAPSAVAGIADYVRAVTASVDGRYADQASMVKLLVGSDTYGHAAQTNLTVDSMSALQHLESISQGVKVTAHMPAVANKFQQGIAVAGGGHLSSKCPIWGGLELASIRDPYTSAAAGIVNLTAIQLWNFKIVRTAPYRQVSFQVLP